MVTGKGTDLSVGVCFLLRKERAARDAHLGGQVSGQSGQSRGAKISHAQYALPLPYQSSLSIGVSTIWPLVSIIKDRNYASCRGSCWRKIGGGQ